MHIDLLRSKSLAKKVAILTILECLVSESGEVPLSGESREAQFGAVYFSVAKYQVSSVQCGWCLGVVICILVRCSLV